MHRAVQCLFSSFHVEQQWTRQSPFAASLCDRVLQVPIRMRMEKQLPENSGPKTGKIQADK